METLSDIGFKSFLTKITEERKNLTPEELKHIEEKRKKYEEEEKRLLEIEAYNTRVNIFGKRHADCTYDNYIISNENQKEAIEKCKAYMKMDKRNGESLLMYGKSGTGKNHLLVAMFRDEPNNIKIAKLEFLNAEKMELQKKGKNWMSGLEMYCTCKYLIIPDLVVREGGLSDSIKELLLYIIDERYNNMLPVVICTNVDVKGLKQAIDFEGTERVSDRLRQMIQNRIVVMNWESYRK